MTGVLAFAAVLLLMAPRGRSGARAPLPRPPLWVLGLAAGVGGVPLLGPGWAVVVGAVALGVRSQRRDGRRRHERQQEVSGRAALLDAVAAELAAGRDLPGACAAAGLEVPGAADPDLAVVGVLCARTGTPAAEVVTRLAAVARTAEAHDAALAAVLAGPRSTVLVLALLPVVGLALGSSLGGNPVRTLLATGPGLVCLVFGVGLQSAGTAWTTALLRRAER